MEKSDFHTIESMHIKEMERLRVSFREILNRLIDTENYCEKYLPYNMFVQYTELLHFALEPESIKKFRDYERAKI